MKQHAIINKKRSFLVSIVSVIKIRADKEIVWVLMLHPTVTAVIQIA